MAKKRRIEVEDRKEPVSEGKDDIPKKYRDTSWGDWFRGTYARWWYVVICMFIDLILALEISRFLPDPWLYLIPVMLVITLTMMEVYVFHRIWGGLDLIFGDRRFL